MLNQSEHAFYEAPHPQIGASERALRPVARHTGEAMKVERTEQRVYSEQTVWMLAIRDRRDKTAFASLFDHFAPKLRGMLMKSAMSAAQADDIVQDVMLSVWRKADSFNPERADVAGWIFQIARNRQIDVIRRERRPVPEDIAGPDTVDVDAEQVVAMEQEARNLRDALGKLKPEQREVLEKAYLGELSHSEIQSETGLPLGTIKSRIRLGLERLRHELKGQR